MKLGNRLANSVVAVFLVLGALILTTTAAFGVGVNASDPTDDHLGDDAEPYEDPVLDAAIAALEPTARRLFPDTYAGAYMTEGVGGPIFIAFTTGAEESVERLAQAFPQPQLLQAVTFEHSLAELEAKQERMIEDRERIHLGQLEIPGIPQHYDLDIDVTRNAVIVIVPTWTPAIATAFKTRYGDDVRIDPGPLAEVADCTRNDCRYQLRSGLRMKRGDFATSGIYCSSAFVVWHPEGGRQILSAGHCSGEARRHGSDDGQAYGEVRGQQFAGRVDAERHSIEGPFTHQPSIFVNADAKSRDVTSTGRWEGLMPGKILCKSGYRTGKSCGQVRGKHYSPDYMERGARFIKADFCVKPGDSGSGVYRDHRAHGIVSGATTGIPCGDPDFYSLSGHIEYVENHLNVNVSKP